MPDIVGTDVLVVEKHCLIHVLRFYRLASSKLWLKRLVE